MRFSPHILSASLAALAITMSTTATAEPLLPKIQWQSEDKGTVVRFLGFIQGDAGHIENDMTHFKTRSEFTRFRLGFKGKIAHDIDYFYHHEFGRDKSFTTNAWVGYNGLESVKFRIGQMKEPISLDFLTSTKHVHFITRASIFSLIPRFSLGGQVAIPYEYGAITAGVFGGNVKNFHQDEDKHAVTGRATYVPINEGSEVLHLGVTGSARWLNDETNKIRFKDTSEINVIRQNLVDTKGITGADRQHIWGVEAAYQDGPMHLQGQYLATTVERTANGQGADVTFDGYYLQAAYVLTGESRQYKKLPGVFKGITPAKAVNDGGYGAWEVAARYSVLDLDDGDINGGIERTSKIGLNWYATEDVQVMLNASISEAETSKGTDNPAFFGARVQFAF